MVVPEREHWKEQVLRVPEQEDSRKVASAMAPE
jgi:hypothetical protein